MQQALLTSVSGPCHLRRWIYTIYTIALVPMLLICDVYSVSTYIIIKSYHDASHKMGGNDTLTSLSDFSPQPAKLTSICRYIQP